MSKNTSKRDQEPARKDTPHRNTEPQKDTTTQTNKKEPNPTQDLTPTTRVINPTAAANSAIMKNKTETEVTNLPDNATETTDRTTHHPDTRVPTDHMMRTGGGETHHTAQTGAGAETGSHQKK